MKLSKEMKKLLKQMAGKTAPSSPSTTGFSQRTFAALHKRGLVEMVGVGNRTNYLITAEGNTASIAN